MEVAWQALALSKLSRGPAGECKEWHYDPANHIIVLWLPMRLAEARGGMHTISAGILSNTGKVPAKVIYDLSPLYERLTDPTVWEDGRRDIVFWKRDGGPSGVNVGDWRLGALFEIGRLLYQHGFDGRIGDAWHPGQS
jgi:hypothetical protein